MVRIWHGPGLLYNLDIRTLMSFVVISSTYNDTIHGKCKGSCNCVQKHACNVKHTTGLMRQSNAHVQTLSAKTLHDNAKKDI